MQFWMKLKNIWGRRRTSSGNSVSALAKTLPPYGVEFLRHSQFLLQGLCAGKRSWFLVFTILCKLDITPSPLAFFFSALFVSPVPFFLLGLLGQWNPPFLVTLLPCLCLGVSSPLLMLHLPLFAIWSSCSPPSSSSSPSDTNTLGTKPEFSAYTVPPSLRWAPQLPSVNFWSHDQFWSFPRF